MPRSVPSPSHEPDDISVQNAVPFSPRVRVVVVGQAEVVAELVGEDAEAAVLRLDRVVAEPVVRVADLGAAEQDLLAADVGPVMP